MVGDSVSVMVLPTREIGPSADPSDLPDDFRLLRALVPYFDRIELCYLSYELWKLQNRDSTFYVKGTEPWLVVSHSFMAYDGFAAATENLEWLRGHYAGPTWGELAFEEARVAHEAGVLAIPLQSERGLTRTHGSAWADDPGVLLAATQRTAPWLAEPQVDEELISRAVTSLARPESMRSHVDAFPDAPIEVALELRDHVREAREAFLAASRASDRTAEAFDVLRREVQAAVAQPRFHRLRALPAAQLAFCAPRALLLRESLRHRRQVVTRIDPRRIALASAADQRSGDPFERLAQELERFSSGDDDGWAADRLHSLCAALFGLSSEPIPLEENANIPVPDVHSPVLDVASLIPIPDPEDVSLVTTLLERTTLYSGLTVMVLPFSLKTAYLSHVSPDSILVYDEAAAEAVLHANLLHADLVAGGKCLFVPRESHHAWHSEASTLRRDVSAPLLQPTDGLTFSPANLAGRDVERRLGDTLHVYKQIVLPYFPGADVDLLGRIAVEETDGFRAFNRWLTRRLAHLATAITPSDLAEILDSIDEQVDLLAKEARKISMMKTLRDIDVGFFTVSLALLSQVPEGSRGLIAGLLGTASFADLVRQTTKRHYAEQELRKSTFYVPWILKESTGKDAFGL